MRKIVYLGVILSTFLLNSCERDLNQLSPTKVAIETSLNGDDPTAFQAAIDGAYDNLKNSGYFAGDTSQLGIPDEITDNLVINPQGRQTNFLAYNWNFNSTNGSVNNLFILGYYAISQANLPLKYIDNLEDGPYKTNIIAQARAFRGMVHFDLVRAYCKIPTQSADANTSMGIDYVTTFDPTLKSEGRKLTVAQVYDKIIEDLKYAADNLTITSTDKGRLTKAAVQGLLSRVYLYKGDYDNAILYGNLSIAASPSVGSLANFTNVWASNNTDGVLFKVLNATAEGVTVGVVYQQGATATGGNIKSEYVVPKSFYDLFAANDIRKTAYMRRSNYTSGSSTTTRNHVIKWAYNTGGGTPLNVTEVKYIRTAEVYLNVAEAALRKATKDEALANQLLNTLKAQRYTGYTPVNLTGQALLDEVLLQRRLELAFEVDRFYTLKRLGLPMQRTGEGPNIDGTGAAAVTQFVAAGDYRWQWPIPQSSINKDANIPQNPNY